MKLQQRLHASISRRAGEVLLRRDVAGLGSSSQVSLALRCLVAEGTLARLGEGIYAKAMPDPQTGQPRPRVSFVQLVREYLGRVGIEATVDVAGSPDSNVRVNVTGRRGRHLCRRLAWEGQRALFVKPSSDIGSLRTRAGRKVVAPPAEGADHLAGKSLDYRAEIAAEVVALAKKHRVSYTRSALDRWAEHVTRLAGDDLGVDDPVKETLRALLRAEKISRKHMFKMMMEYVTGRPSARSI